MTRKKVSSLSKEELVDEVMNLQHQVSLLQKMVFGLKAPPKLVAIKSRDLIAKLEGK